ncbi:MAG: glycine cleavage system protein H [Chlamydiae bacterium RIFCSPHIGHO2_12_FULL_49_9]|nr:MAG: glycine cleavage system protein H [Chlamydiae bacterium RIFCSPHIGHO2_12_FULL_49_9]
MPIYFTESHEWVKVDGEIATVGITNYAQKELGEIVFIELPKQGRKARSGEEIAVLESTKAAADIYAPISGKITSVNIQLKEQPLLINENPEDEGWLFQMEISHPEELTHLLSVSQYQAMIS